MSQQENIFSRRKRLGMRLDFMLKRKVLAGIAAIVMGASLVFTLSASAHDIDVEKAREMSRDYARTVHKERNYLHYKMNCNK